MARNQNTFEKHKREAEKKRKAEEKRARRRKKKEETNQQPDALPAEENAAARDA